MNLKHWVRTNPDRAGAWTAVALGAIVLFLGWQGASTTEYPAEQLPYIISGGIGGALLVAVGATLLISADLRDEWRKLDRIERRLQAAAGPPEIVTPTTAAPSTSLADDVDSHATHSDDAPNGRSPRRVLTARRAEP
jgi:hypothetical protein